MTTERTADGRRFFTLGFVLSAACTWLIAEWYTIANDVLGLGVVYDTRPAWLVVVMEALGWLPWAVLALLAIIRARRGPVVRPLAYALGAATPYVLLVGWVLGGPSVSDRWHRTAFDPAGWRQNDGARTDWPARLRMVDDLLARRTLIGLRADSLDRLLGPREETAYFRDWDRVYWLGPERGLIRIDSEWLGIRFSADGTVTEVRILRD